MTRAESGGRERGSSDPRSTLLWLAGFVVLVGGVSWALAGIGHHAPPRHRSPPIVTPGPTPGLVDCRPSELALVGAFNDCARSTPVSAATCSASGQVLEVTLQLAGRSADAFLLFIEVDGGYIGPGSSYALPPWPHAMGTKGDVAKVALQQDGTSAFWRVVGGVPVQQYDTAAWWQSVAGILTVTGSDGRSGTVSAILDLAAINNTTVQGSRLTINGDWSCP